MSKISEKIKNLDLSKEVEALIKEQLETLVSLTNHITEAAETSIRNRLKQGIMGGGMEGSLEVPITYIIQHTTEERAIAQESKSEIINKIGEGISHFFNPGKQEILNGVVNILSSSIDALLGAGEGMESTQDIYLVAAEYPSLVRMDFHLWMRNTRAVGLSNVCKSALSVVGFKSAVDVKKLDFSTFSAIYAPLLKESYGADMKSAEKALAAAESLYKKLGGKMTPDQNVTLPQLTGPLCSPISTVPSKILEF